MTSEPTTYRHPRADVLVSLERLENLLRQYPADADPIALRIGQGTGTGIVIADVWNLRVAAEELRAQLEENLGGPKIGEVTVDVRPNLDPAAFAEYVRQIAVVSERPEEWVRVKALELASVFEARHEDTIARAEAYLAYLTPSSVARLAGDSELAFEGAPLREWLAGVTERTSAAGFLTISTPGESDYMIRPGDLLDLLGGAPDA